jgi:hypothetical protein
MLKWMTEPNPVFRRRVGKTGEECAELQKVLCRISMQGLDGCDPRTLKPNRVDLEDEIADVLAQIDLTIDALKLDYDRIAGRANVKRLEMHQWERMYEPGEG